MTTVEDAILEPRLVGDITGAFLVPAYQRGYRWGAHEVQQLLDDLWAATAEPGTGSYYLQPVVVKRAGDEWELIDGQQRLTTLFLIFQYLYRAGLKSSGANYHLRYATRPGSGEFLRSIDDDRRRENLDFLHLSIAYDTIRSWFEVHGTRHQYAADKIYGALFERARVIWYEAPDDVDSITLFTRLNVGRIPLSDAELVKALLLSRLRHSAGITDRSLEAATQWDMIERDLREPELWAFLTGRADEEPTHIGLIFDILAGRADTADPGPFFTFQRLRDRISADPQAFFEEVLDLYSLLRGWYADQHFFHKIGYLVTQRTALLDLVNDAQGVTKSEFDSRLDDRIRRSLKLTGADLDGLTYQRAESAGRALLLMNVETIRTRKGESAERFSFHEYAKGSWSLEHIHAQNAEPLTTAEQWRTWLDMHRRALTAATELEDAVREELIARIDATLAQDLISRDQFRSLEQSITTLLSANDVEDDDVHAIDNLALLSSGDNSALSNSTFAVKRARILRLDATGSFIPACTRNVFLKYYSRGTSAHWHFWGSEDRRAYRRALESKLAPYLSGQHSGTDGGDR